MKRLLLTAIAFGLTAMIAAAQSPAASAASTPATQTQSIAPSDYAIGAGDVLTITIADADDFSGKYRVSDDGAIIIPGLKSPIQAAGHSAAEVSAAITKALVQADLIRDPMVHVFVEEYQSRNITVLGAVQKPSVYPLSRSMTVLEVLSLAGGPTINAGDTLTVIRKPIKTAGSDAPGVTQRFVIEMNKLMAGKDVNMAVEPGDVVTLSSAPVIYVVGAVNKPGAFPVPNARTGGVTVLEALALAEGTKSVAAMTHGVVVHRSEDNIEHQDIPVNLADVMHRRPTNDVKLQDNDILFVPESGSKKTLQALGQIAIAATAGIAVYGIGYRLGTK
jgi:polysaccharide biosynthesis/export protein